MRVLKENVPKLWVFSITCKRVFCTLKTFLQCLKSAFFLLAKEKKTHHDDRSLTMQNHHPELRL